jgi:hypothetical protein
MSKSPANDNSSAKRTPVCPICGRPRAPKHRPFCSRRCADVDLHRWFRGAYAIPVAEELGDETPAQPKDTDQSSKASSKLKKDG